MRLSRSERVESSGVIIPILFCWLSDIITKHYPARWRMQISDLYIYTKWRTACKCGEKWVCVARKRVILLLRDFNLPLPGR
jgi:hypothetical protein